MENEFQIEVLSRLTRIETKLDDYDTNKKESEKARAKVESNERRINELEDKIKWLSRTTVGALITGGVAILFCFLKIGLNI